MHITPLTPSMVGIDASRYHGRRRAQDGHILKDTSWGGDGEEIRMKGLEALGQPRDRHKAKACHPNLLS